MNSANPQMRSEPNNGRPHTAPSSPAVDDARFVRPRVIGIASVLLASYAFFCLAFNAVGIASFIRDALRNALSRAPAAAELFYATRWVHRIVSVPVLAVAGVALYKRCRFAGTLHVLYAVVSLLLSTVVWPYVDDLVYQSVGSSGCRMTVWPMGNPLLHFYYPIFLLLWFGIAWVRRQAWKLGW